MYSLAEDWYQVYTCQQHALVPVCHGIRFTRVSNRHSYQYAMVSGLHVPATGTRTSMPWYQVYKCQQQGRVPVCHGIRFTRASNKHAYQQPSNKTFCSLKWFVYLCPSQSTQWCQDQCQYVCANASLAYVKCKTKTLHSGHRLFTKAFCPVSGDLPHTLNIQLKLNNYFISKIFRSTCFIIQSKMATTKTNGSPSLSLNHI